MRNVPQYAIERYDLMPDNEEEGMNGSMCSSDTGDYVEYEAYAFVKQDLELKTDEYNNAQARVTELEAEVARLERANEELRLSGA